MIILGIVLLVVAWIVPALGVPIPPPIEELLTFGGWILIVIGVILFIFHLFGRPVGPGFRGRRGIYF